MVSSFCDDKTVAAANPVVFFFQHVLSQLINQSEFPSFGLFNIVETISIEVLKFVRLGSVVLVPNLCQLPWIKRLVERIHQSAFWTGKYHIFYAFPV